MSIDQITAQAISQIADEMRCSDAEARERYSHSLTQLLHPTASIPATKTFITYSELRDRYIYRDGHLYYKRDVFRHRAGSIASWYAPNSSEYFIHYNGRSYQQCKLIWLYHHGVLPTHVIHLNEDNSDDRIENLQQCTFGELRDHNYRVAKKATGVDQPAESESIPEPISQKDISEEIPLSYDEDDADIDYGREQTDGGIIALRDADRHGGKKWVVVIPDDHDRPMYHATTFTVTEAYAIYQQLRKR